MQPWEVTHNPYAAATDLHARKMTANLEDTGPCAECGADHAHAVRLHEMGHVAWTPLDWSDRARAEGFDIPVVQAVEDGRLNLRHRTAGTSPDPMVCDRDFDFLVNASITTRDYSGLLALSAAATGTPQAARWEDAVAEAAGAGRMTAEEAGALRRGSRDIRRALSQDSFGETNGRPTFSENTLEGARVLQLYADHAKEEREKALAREADEKEDAESRDEDGWKEDRDGKGRLRVDMRGEDADGAEFWWGPMTVDEPPRPKRTSAWTRRTRQRDEGVVLARPDRLLTDGRVFTRKARKRGADVGVVVDCSGSMGLTDAELSELLEALPGATVAFYSGSSDSGGPGTLRVVAKDGRRVTSEYVGAPHGQGNDVDGPALAWLNRQDVNHRFWISDGGITGGGSHTGLRKDTERHLRRGNIMQVEDYRTVVQVRRRRAPFIPAADRWRKGRLTGCDRDDFYYGE